MIQTSSGTDSRAQFVKVGFDVFPVYGDDLSGWSVDPLDLSPGRPSYRYESLEELFFALVNFNLCPEGTA